MKQEVVNQQPPIVEPSETPKPISSVRSKPAIIAVVLIVILFVIATAGYFIIQNKKATTSSPPISKDLSISDWKTYKNDIVGFSFQYPDDLIADGNNLIRLDSPGVNKNGPLPNDPDLLSIYVGISQNRFKNFEDFKSDEIKNFKFFGHKGNISESTIDGVKMLHIIVNSEREASGYVSPGSESYQAIINGYIVSISKSPQLTTRQAEFEKMISTVKLFKPTKSLVPVFVNPATAWQQGTVAYDNASLGISFEYPKSFIFNSPKIDNGTIYLSITTPEVSAEEAASPGFDYSAYDSEAMRVSISKFTNTENLSLYDFIAKQHKTYPGNGITDTFDTYKKYLTSTGIPRPGSYMFNGNVSENPVKTVYFEHNGSVYAFNLGGGRGTGQSYSADADKLFNKILQISRGRMRFSWPKRNLHRTSDPRFTWQPSKTTTFKQNNRGGRSSRRKKNRSWISAH